MMGQLLTLSIRLSARAATLLLRGTEHALNRAFAIADWVAGHAGAQPESAGGPHAEPESAIAEPESAVAEPESAVAPPPTVQQPPPSPEPEAYAETPAEPQHVSEEPTLVAAFAEPGAEDGAGAQVRVDEPWDGYRQMTAKGVIEQLSVANAAQLAAVGLYERVNQNRPTVLSAVERQLQLTTRGGSAG